MIKWVWHPSQSRITTLISTSVSFSILTNSSINYSGNLTLESAHPVPCKMFDCHAVWPLLVSELAIVKSLDRSCMLKILLPVRCSETVSLFEDVQVLLPDVVHHEVLLLIHHAKHRPPSTVVAHFVELNTKHQKHSTFTRECKANVKIVENLREMKRLDPIKTAVIYC